MRTILIRYSIRKSDEKINAVKTVYAEMPEFAKVVLINDLVSNGVAKEDIVIYRYFDITDSDKDHIENIKRRWTRE